MALQTISVGSLGNVNTYDDSITPYPANFSQLAVDEFLLADANGDMIPTAIGLYGGNMSGPGPSVTPDALAIFSGTGGLTVKETAVIATVAGAMSGITTLAASGAITGSNLSGTNTGDMSNAEVKTAYEANADTNAYTDSEQTIVGNTSNTNTGDQAIALTGDVTGTWAAGTIPAVIAVDAVDIAMLSASGVADATTWLRGDNSWQTPAGGGDVVGPGSALADALASFDGTTGKLLRDDTFVTLGSGVMTFIGSTQPQIIMDSAASVSIALDRGADNDVCALRHKTAGVEKWFAGLSRSDLTGFDGTEYFVGQTEANPEFWIHPTTGVFINSQITGPASLTLQTGDTEVIAGNVLGRIDFQAPFEASGTDAIVVSASIRAEATEVFDASDNSTKLVFATAISGTVIDRVTIDENGESFFDVGGGLVTLPATGTNTAATFTGYGQSAIAIIAENLTGKSFVYFGDEDDEDIGRIRYDHSTDAISFFTNAAEGLTIDSAQGVELFADFTVDTNTLFVDSANSRVGMGTLVPNKLLEVQSGSTTLVIPLIVSAPIGSNAEVGIGLSGFPQGSASPPKAAIFLKRKGSFGIGDMIFSVDPTADANDVNPGTDMVMYLEGSTGNVGVGVAAPTAKLHVDQSSSSGAIPVLTLDQADVSEEFIRLIGSSADGTVPRSLVDVVDMTTAGALVGWFQINVQDVQSTNPIADGAYYVPFYAAPSA